MTEGHGFGAKTGGVICTRPAESLLTGDRGAYRDGVYRDGAYCDGASQGGAAKHARSASRRPRLPTPWALPKLATQL
jgi:hypothetical protein